MKWIKATDAEKVEALLQDKLKWIGIRAQTPENKRLLNLAIQTFHSLATGWDIHTTNDRQNDK